MTTTIGAPTSTRRPRASRAARRFGYVVAVAVNSLMLYLIHGWPGWDAVPFLSAETTDVLPYVDASIVASIVVNTAYVVRDGRLTKAAGELLVNLVSLLSLIRFWQVWPFDFDGVWGGWQPLVYVMLAVATVGTAVSALVQVVTLLRASARPGSGF